MQAGCSVLNVLRKRQWCFVSRIGRAMSRDHSEDPRPYQARAASRHNTNAIQQTSLQHRRIRSITPQRDIAMAASRNVSNYDSPDGFGRSVAFPGPRAISSSRGGLPPLLGWGPSRGASWGRLGAAEVPGGLLGTPGAL